MSILCYWKLPNSCHDIAKKIAELALNSNHSLILSPDISFQSNQWQMMTITRVFLNIIRIETQKYRITGNFCGVKFLRFWSKKMTFNFCEFLFLRIENLGTEKKIICITGSNNWSDVAINNWCTLQWSLEVKTYLVL